MDNNSTNNKTNNHLSTHWTYKKTARYMKLEIQDLAWEKPNSFVVFFLFNNLSKIKFLVVLKYILVNKDHVLVIFIF